MAFQPFGVDEQEELSLRMNYRQVFDTPVGKRVLAHMLVELGMFDTQVNTERSQGRQDYAKRLLWIMGITDERNIKFIVDGLMKMPLHAKGDKRGAKEKKE